MVCAEKYLSPYLLKEMDGTPNLVSNDEANPIVERLFKPNLFSMVLAKWTPFNEAVAAILLKAEYASSIVLEVLAKPADLAPNTAISCAQSSGTTKVNNKKIKRKSLTKNND